MKNILLALLALLSLSAQAQRDKPDPSIKPGSFTVIGSVGFPKMSSVSREHDKSLKAMLLTSVDYQATREFIIGFQYAYNHSAHDLITMSYVGSTAYQLERSATWHTYMLTAEICYLNRGRWNLSGGVGFGMQFNHYNQNTIDSIGMSKEYSYKGKDWAGRIRLANVKLRITNNLGAYAGVGLGYDGLATVGACYSFSGSEKPSHGYSSKKYRKEAELAITPGSVTLVAATGYPNFFGFNYGPQSKSVGPLMLAGEYQVSKRFYFGMQYSYHYSNSGLTTGHTYSHYGNITTLTSTYQYERRHSRHMLMATADYCYLNKGRVSVSTGIGLGWTVYYKSSEYFSDNINRSGILNDSYYRSWPAFRFRLANVKVRVTKNLGVYGGVGLGTDGLVAGGLFYTFTGNK